MLISHCLMFCLVNNKKRQAVKTLVVEAVSYTHLVICPMIFSSFIQRNYRWQVVYILFMQCMVFVCVIWSFDEMGPVSYTHLDVYKRQDLGIPDFTSEFQFSNGAFSVADSGFTVDMAALDRRLTPQPVSYTHLDVYKRQLSG